MPLGQRQKELVAKAQTMFDRFFAGRILPFDSFGAVEYATIWALRRVAGRPISEFDCQIAAVGRAKLASVATRNVRDFEGCGVEILNPWDLPK